MDYDTPSLFFLSPWLELLSFGSGSFSCGAINNGAISYCAVGNFFYNNFLNGYRVSVSCSFSLRSLVTARSERNSCESYEHKC